MTDPGKKVVYIASPYSKGDACINARFQCLTFDIMMNDGIVWPVAPLWTHFQHNLFPRSYKDWIEYDLAMLTRYDACIRLAATEPALNYRITESSGADGEEAAFRAQNKPVFYDFASLYDWAKNS